MKTYAYKFLDGDEAPHTHFAWPLPRDGKPGKWVTAKGDLEVCGNGVHAVTLDEGSDILNWLRSDCYVIELDGPIIEGHGKLCARRGRLLRKIEAWSPRSRARFAADCAARVAEYNSDPRVKAAIAAPRAWARHPCDKHAEAATAASKACLRAMRTGLPAANAAVRSASAAARSGSAAAGSALAAYSTTYFAAGAFAWATIFPATSLADAVDSDTYSATYSEETHWQLNRLKHYLGPLP